MIFQFEFYLTFKQMVTFRTCVVHSTRRPVHFLDQFGSRPCKYKCKSILPCTSQSLSSSHRSMTTAHRVLPSKRFKRGVLKLLFKRLRIKKKSRPISYCIEQEHRAICLAICPVPCSKIASSHIAHRGRTASTRQNRLDAAGCRLKWNRLERQSMLGLRCMGAIFLVTYTGKRFNFLSKSFMCRIACLQLKLQL